MKLLRGITLLLGSLCAMSSSATELSTELSDSSQKKIQVGPSVSLLSVPRLVTVGVEMKYDNFLGVGLDYGILPSLKMKGVDEMSISEPRLNVYVYPWKQTFYAGLSLSRSSIHAVKNKDGTTAEITANMVYLIPKIGWRWVAKSGFFFSTEIGAMYCINASVNTSSNDPDVQEMMATRWAGKKIADGEKQAQGQIAPYFSLIQLGWYL